MLNLAAKDNFKKLHIANKGAKIVIHIICIPDNLITWLPNIQPYSRQTSKSQKKTVIHSVLELAKTPTIFKEVILPMLQNGFCGHVVVCVQFNWWLLSSLSDGVLRHHIIWSGMWLHQCYTVLLKVGPVLFDTSCYPFPLTGHSFWTQLWLEMFNSHPYRFP